MYNKYTQLSEKYSYVAEKKKKPTNTLNIALSIPRLIKISKNKTVNYSSIRHVATFAKLFYRVQRGLCCFPGLSTVGARAGNGRGEEALLLERQGRASQQTRSSSLPPPPSALPRPPRKPSARNTRYDRLEHRDGRKVSRYNAYLYTNLKKNSVVICCHVWSSLNLTDLWN